MTNLSQQIEQINSAEKWWCETGYIAIRDYFVSLCRDHLAGKKVFKVDGALTVAYEKQRIQLIDFLRAGAPSNARVHFYPKHYGEGVFRTLQMVTSCDYTVRNQNGESCSYVPWYLSLEFSTVQLESLLSRPAPVFEPLTVEIVEGLRAAAKTYELQMSELKSKLSDIKHKLSVLG